MHIACSAVALHAHAKKTPVTVMANDFELNIPVNNGTSEISVKWGVNIAVFSCYFTVFK